MTIWRSGRTSVRAALRCAAGGAAHSPGQRRPGVPPLPRPAPFLPQLWLAARSAVFNLVEGVNVSEMEARIKEYRLANAENILQNEARKVRPGPGGPGRACRATGCAAMQPSACSGTRHLQAAGYGLCLPLTPSPPACFY